MKQTDITKSLLLNQTCQTCQTQKGTQVEEGKKVKMCIQFLGEAIGWQWFQQSKKETCDSWLDVVIK